MGYAVNYMCVSHIGNRRQINQDNFVCNGIFLEQPSARPSSVRGSADVRKKPVFGIFDGMGGLVHGEIASLIAARNAAAINIGKDAVSALELYCQKSNQMICDYAERHLCAAMGTTAAMLTFSRQEVTLCNVGDSKIFRCSNSGLEQISQDHVVRFPGGQKPRLSQNLGIPSQVMSISPYFAKGLCLDGDRYLICSDGLTDTVPSEMICEIMRVSDFESIAPDLLSAALSLGGRDNITILVCQLAYRPWHQRERGA